MVLEGGVVGREWDEDGFGAGEEIECECEGVGRVLGGCACVWVEWDDLRYVWEGRLRRSRG